MCNLDFWNNFGKWNTIYWNNEKWILHSLSEQKGLLFPDQTGPTDRTDDFSTPLYNSNSNNLMTSYSTDNGTQESQCQ